MPNPPSPRSAAAQHRRPLPRPARRFGNHDAPPSPSAVPVSRKARPAGCAPPVIRTRTRLIALRVYLSGAIPKPARSLTSRFGAVRQPAGFCARSVSASFSLSAFSGRDPHAVLRPKSAPCPAQITVPCSAGGKPPGDAIEKNTKRGITNEKSTFPPPVRAAARAAVRRLRTAGRQPHAGGTVLRPARLRGDHRGAGRIAADRAVCVRSTAADGNGFLARQMRHSHGGRPVGKLHLLRSGYQPAGEHTGQYVRQRDGRENLLRPAVGRQQHLRQVRADRR